MFFGKPCGGRRRRAVFVSKIATSIKLGSVRPAWERASRLTSAASVSSATAVSKNCQVDSCLGSNDNASKEGLHGSLEPGTDQQASSSAAVLQAASVIAEQLLAELGSETVGAGQLGSEGCSTERVQQQLLALALEALKTATSQQTREAALQRLCTCLDAIKAELQRTHTLPSCQTLQKGMADWQALKSMQDVGPEHRVIKAFDANKNCWQEILQQLSILAVLVSAGHLKMQEVLEQLQPILKGKNWMFDIYSSTWCSPHDTPLIVEDDNQVSPLSSAVPVPLIALKAWARIGETQLQYKSEAGQAAAPAGQVLLQMFGKLGVPLMATVRVPRISVVHAKPLPDNEAKELKQLLISAGANHAAHACSESINQHITDSLPARADGLMIKTAFELKVQHTLPLHDQRKCHNQQQKVVTVLEEKRSTAAVYDRTNNVLYLKRCARRSGLQLDTDLYQREAAAALAQIVLHGSDHSAEDERCLADNLLPLVRSDICNLHEPPFEEVIEPVVLEAKRVPAPPKGRYHSECRKFLTLAQIHLSGMLDLATLVSTRYWRSINNHMVDRRDFAGPVEVLIALLTAKELHPPVYFEATFIEQLLPLYYQLFKEPTTQSGMGGEMGSTLFLLLMLADKNFLVEFAEDIKRSGGPFDIRIRTPEGAELLIEVKATNISAHRDVAAGHAHNFNLTTNEYEAAKKYGDAYVLIRAYGVPVKDGKPRLGFLVIRNPLEQKRLGRITMTKRKTTKRVKRTIGVGAGLRAG